MADDTIEEIKKAAVDLAERARLGDQNAMGMLEEIRNAAESGNERAKTSFSILMDYVKNHPSPGHGAQPTPKPSKRKGNIYRLLRAASHEKDLATFAGDIAELSRNAPDHTAAAVCMADGCLMTRERMEAIAKLMGGEKEQRLFYFCCHNTSGKRMRILIQVIPEECRPIIKAGSAVGMARKIQGIRSGRMPLARLSPMVAWELGE